MKTVVPEPKSVAFDIDGTILEVGHRINWRDPASVDAHTRPFPSALSRLRDLLGDGHYVHFVTSRGPVLGAVTVRQLARHLGYIPPRCRVFLSPDVVYDHARTPGNKMDALRVLQPDVYVGDLDGDRLAADLAGVPFLDAAAWRHGADYPWGRGRVGVFL